jgi:galacturan 1,4-alpha-galacturonidase
MTIQHIVFKNFHGTTSKKNDPRIGSLVCSAKNVCDFLSSKPRTSFLNNESKQRCSDIRASNISVTPPSGKTAQFTCTNMENSLLSVKCS